MKKDQNSIKSEIEKLDKAISELVNSVKIKGDIDQSGSLIIYEDETLPEAVKRYTKINDLRKKKKELEELLE